MNFYILAHKFNALDSMTRLVRLLHNSHSPVSPKEIAHNLKSINIF